MGEREQVEARLRAYIRPNEVTTDDEEIAFDQAVEAQLAWEQRAGEELPPGVASLSIGDYSLRASEADGAAHSRANICPAAWAFLLNAGLLRRSLPQARPI